jgi:hypothetical protein
LHPHSQVSLKMAMVFTWWICQWLPHEAVALPAELWPAGPNGVDWKGRPVATGPLKWSVGSRGEPPWRWPAVLAVARLLAAGEL